MDSPAPDEIMEFPCEFPLKVMGDSEGIFRETVLAIVEQHVPDLDPSRVESRESRSGKYTSLTIPFTAESRAQLDALYQALTDCEAVKVAL